jgi:hypothetical protein
MCEFAFTDFLHQLDIGAANEAFAVVQQRLELAVRLK